MTAASLRPGPDLFSAVSLDRTSKTRREAFVFSLLGQAAVLALIVYLTTRVLTTTPIERSIPHAGELPLIFSGMNGGGGGGRDPLPASYGNPPRASLQMQILSPTVMLPTRMPALPVAPTVEVAPEVKFPQAGQIGDPMSKFRGWLSNGPGRDGIGNSCCGGIGDSVGPYVGSGSPGIYPAGRNGVTAPEVIYSIEPNFSEEARQKKYQGIVLLVLVVGKDGKPSNIHVRQSLGMGLDEKAIEAVDHWRFRPATLNGQPVATQIAVEVNFRLY